MRKSKRKWSIFLLILSILLVNGISVLASGTDAEGQEKKEVLVGYTSYDYMIKKDSDGKFYGYGVTYLENLSEIAGWNVQYVEVEESQRIEKLQNGEIDLLCSLHNDSQENTELVFSKDASGMEYGMLCALKDNNDIFFNDYEALNGKKIGINKSSDLEKVLVEFAEKHNITYEPVYFEQFVDMEEALTNKEIDVMIASNLRDVDNIKYVGKIDFIDTYFAAGKINLSLMEELDKADALLKQEQPFYIAASYSEFYGNPQKKLTGITREEHEFIVNNPSIKVACDGGSYPIEYVDEETGEYAGVYAEAMDLIMEETGLQFEFIPLEGFEDAWEMLSSGEVDLIAGNYGNSELSEYYNIIYSESYLSAEYTLVGNKNKELGTEMTIAIPTKFVGIRSYFKNNAPNWEILLYDSVEDCLKAVNRGEADVTSINSIFLQTVYNLNNYDNLKIVPNMTQSIPISMGIGKNNTQVLKSILDKAIYQIPEYKFQKCIAENAINISYQPSILESLREFFPYIAILLLLIVLSVALIIRRREKHYRHLAMTDSITGLWNRRKFYQEATALLEKNTDRTYLLITLDINKFKFINNDFGAHIGDVFLRVLGNRIRDIFEGKGYFARNTADMFLILIEEQKFHEDMLEPLGKEIYFDENGSRQYYKIVIKSGIRTIRPEEENRDLRLYIDQATLARKTVKDNVNKNLAYYDEKMKENLERENVIEKKMEAALQNGEFQAYLQPKYNLQSGEIIGAEALVRWIEPGKGIIPPDQFIPLFEKNGFILDVDFYVYEEVLKRMAAWKSQGKKLICISVNVSRVHVGTRDFFEKLNQLVERYQIPKKYFELELTETIMGSEKSATRTFIRECKQEGYQVSIDDFGSGYSSLNLLKDLPVDILKIDKGFLDETEESRRSAIIIEQVVEMAKKMQIRTLCEGVETEKQAQFLKQIGCNMAQGYLFSKPVPMDDFEKMM